MKDISEHVRITAAIACGAALGYRSDWDLGTLHPEYLIKSLTNLLINSLKESGC